MQFDFGKNWDSFSRLALSPVRVEQARQDFNLLLKGIALKGSSFLDVGFGQGLSLLVAEECGAEVAGCDINPLCREVYVRNRRYFPHLDDDSVPPIITGSIVDDATVKALYNHGSTLKCGYDIVHSWGVLHHTGNMRKAIKNAASLVGNGGYLVLALYNRHWTSPLWKIIKWCYCKSPGVVQKMSIAIFYPIIVIAKALVTLKNPFTTERGMDFYFDVIDWVGGYPYEYITIDEMCTFMRSLSFVCVTIEPAKVPTGCNQYVFRRVE